MAGLKGDIEVALIEIAVMEVATGAANGEHFGMSGGIAAALHFIMGARDNIAVMDNDGAHGDLIAIGGAASLVERGDHPLLIVWFYGLVVHGRWVAEFGVVMAFISVAQSDRMGALARLARLARRIAVRLRDAKNTTFYRSDARLMRSLGSTLLPRYAAITRKSGITNPALVMYWSEIVGEEWSQYTFPLRITKRHSTRGRAAGSAGELILEIRAPGAVACEMAHCLPELLERINRFHPGPPITGLKYRDLPSKPNPASTSKLEL